MSFPLGVKIGTYDRQGTFIGYFLNGEYFTPSGIKNGHLDENGKYYSETKGLVGQLVNDGELELRGMKVTLKPMGDMSAQ